MCKCWKAARVELDGGGEELLGDGGVEIDGGEGEGIGQRRDVGERPLELNWGNSFRFSLLPCASTPLMTCDRPKQPSWCVGKGGYLPSPHG